MSDATQGSSNAKLVNDMSRFIIVELPAPVTFDARKEISQRIAAALESNPLCPHGMPLAENICGPCSEGRPNRASHEPPAECDAEATRDMLTDARLELDALRSALGVDYEPHQSLHERMLDAANHKRVERGAQGPCPNCGAKWASVELSSSQPPSPEWKPMETAPKDGRKFLAIGMGPMFLCRWASGANIWQDDAGHWRDPRLWQHLPEGPCLLPSDYSTATKGAGDGR